VFHVSIWGVLELCLGGLGTAWGIRSCDRTIVAEISPFEEVVRHAGLYDFTAADFVAKRHAVSSSQSHVYRLCLR